MVRAQGQGAYSLLGACSLLGAWVLSSGQVRSGVAGSLRAACFGACSVAGAQNDHGLT